MKYMILLGFFATIFTVLAVPRGKRLCVEMPSKWPLAGYKCMEKTSMATAISFASYNKTLATKEAKCLALCFYNSTGEFVNSKFDPIAMENDLREHVGPHPLLEKLVKIHVAAANAGNAEEGDDCDKAYAYALVLSLPENARLRLDVFCAGRELN